MKLQHKNKIIITTGDVDGVGFEVTVKALLWAKRKLSNFDIIVFHNSRPTDPFLKMLNGNFIAHNLSGESELIALCRHEDNDSLEGRLYLIKDSRNPTHWVEDAAKFCMKHSLSSGLVTGPLSKQTIWQSGLRDVGHTGILKRLTRCSVVNMGFLGSRFNVVLATDHIPLGEVKKFLRPTDLFAALKNASTLTAILPKRVSHLPIGVLGLNPHSGDGGLIGQEEREIILPVIEKFNREQKFGVLAVGPLVPDAAFLKTQLKKFSLFLAMYHDQGLIPFKSIHGQSGTHITLGIPFVRTSVDHGTAKDIFNKNQANFKSMYDSITWCMTLLKRRAK